METAPSFSFIFDRRKRADATHRGSVELTLFVNGTQARISTGITLYPREWNNGKVIARPDAPQLNKRLDKLYEAVAAIIHTPGITAKGVVDALRHGGGDILSWIKAERIKRRDIAPNTSRHHLSMIKNLEAWGQLGTFSNITVTTLTRWDLHLREQGGRKGSTLQRYHKDLRSYLERAVMAGLLEENPYRRFRMPKVDRASTIKYLTVAERTRIEQLELTDTAAAVRDMFIFCCYTGLAYSDMQNMSPEDVEHTDDGRLILCSSRQKTGSPFRITLLKKAREIADRYWYRFPRLSNQKCNMYLKGIQAAAQIKTKLTMHVARHTFATWALNEGVNIETVSKMLAHSNIDTTQIYAKVLQREVDKGFDMLEEYF